MYFIKVRFLFYYYHSDRGKKIAVLFPGIGYTCDRSLLYYIGKLAAGYGYEIRKVPYGNFPAGVKGNKEKMEQCFVSALTQTEDMLKDVRWEDYDRILFLSKSVGTIVSSAYAEKHSLPAANVLYTPLEQTFFFAGEHCIAFHGTCDPWAETDKIRSACLDKGIPLVLIENANHSLETENVMTNLDNLRIVMEKTERFIIK